MSPSRRLVARALSMLRTTWRRRLTSLRGSRPLRSMPRRSRWTPCRRAPKSLSTILPRSSRSRGHQPNTRRTKPRALSLPRPLNRRRMRLRSRSSRSTARRQRKIKPSMWSRATRRRSAMTQQRLHRKQLPRLLKRPTSFRPRPIDCRTCSQNLRLRCRRRRQPRRHAIKTMRSLLRLTRSHQHRSRPRPQSPPMRNPQRLPLPPNRRRRQQPDERLETAAVEEPWPLNTRTPATPR